MPCILFYLKQLPAHKHKSVHCKFALTQEHLPVLFLVHLHFINSEHTPEAFGSVIHREDNLDKHSLTDIYSFSDISVFYVSWRPSWIFDIIIYPIMM